MADVLSVQSVWADAARLCAAFYAAPNGAFGGAGWFASMSWQPNAELNVCGLDAAADRRSGEELAAVLGPTTEALVFTSSRAPDSARQPLVDIGFDIETIPDPVMCCPTRPSRTTGAFRVTRCRDQSDVAVALDVTAAAHQVPRALLEVSIGRAASRTGTSVWVAWLGDEPVSSVWLARAGSCLGVMEMMTPSQYQGRGAGRAVLSHALDAEWDSTTTHSVLLGTPAGRRLYESLGFVALDESVSCTRGIDDAVQAAIGHG